MAFARLMHRSLSFAVAALLLSIAPVSVAQTWLTRSPQLPIALGEVASAYIGSAIYVVGQGNSSTCQFQTKPWASAWNCSLAQRPAPGNHHACIVPGDGTFWLLGGFNGGGPNNNNAGGLVSKGPFNIIFD